MVKITWRAGYNFCLVKPVRVGLCFQGHFAILPLGMALTASVAEIPKQVESKNIRIKLVTKVVSL